MSTENDFSFNVYIEDFVDFNVLQHSSTSTLKLNSFFCRHKAIFASALNMSTLTTRPLKNIFDGLASVVFIPIIIIRVIFCKKKSSGGNNRHAEHWTWHNHFYIIVRWYVFPPKRARVGVISKKKMSDHLFY